MEHYWKLGKWGGLPVAMHWTVLLAFPWLFLWFRSFIAAAIGTCAFLALLLVHEFGHVLVARWRGVYVQDITLYGMHGQTALGLKRTQLDEVLIAWGGVAAQLLVLLLAVLAQSLLAGVSSSLAWVVLAPVLNVLTSWNIFLIIVALLPIGPMDGHLAWKAFPLIRQSLRKRRKPAPKLSLVQRKELEERSGKAAAEIIEKLRSKK